MARTVRSSTGDPLSRIGMTNSGLTVWSISRRSTLPSRRWRTTLIEPPRRARRAADEHQRKERKQEKRRPEREVGARHSRRRHDRNGLEGGCPDRPLALGDPVPPQHRRQRSRGDHDERDVEPELLVAYKHARPPAHECSIHEREVRARDCHEHDEDPLRLRREGRGRRWLRREAAGGHGRERVRERLVRRHQVVDADAPRATRAAAPGSP